MVQKATATATAMAKATVMDTATHKAIIQKKRKLSGKI